MPADQYLYCSDCADVQLVEMPVCADGHGYECPDRACTQCGGALFVDPVITRERPAARHAA